MHIVLGLLGSIVTILYLLNRLGGLGIDLGWLNPFHWRRRRAWAARYQSDPIYSVDDPVHVAALLIVGSAKLGGDLSAEQKRVAVEQFQANFSLDSKAANGLLGSAGHLLGAPQVVSSQLNGLASRNKDCLSSEQAESMLQMMLEVAAADGELSDEQNSYIDAMRSTFAPPAKGEGPWNS